MGNKFRTPYVHVSFMPKRDIVCIV